MSGTKPTVDNLYRRYAELLFHHHRLLCEGRDDDVETDVVEEEMTPLWDRLDPAQRHSLSGLSSDLNWVRRHCQPPPRGKKAEEVTPQDLEALAKAREDGDWHRLLHFLRLCAPKTPSSELAHWRGKAWAALDFPQLAGLFGNLAAERDRGNSQ